MAEAQVPVGLVNVLLAFPAKQKHLEALAPVSKRIRLTVAASPEEIAGALREVEVLACLPQVVPVPWGPAPRLRWVHVLTAGADAVLPHVPAGVVVTVSRGIQADAVADHALALLLALTRGIARFRDRQRVRLWDRHVRVDELAGKTAAVLGLGPVGRAIARRARAFGLRVLGVSRTGNYVPDVDECLPISRLAEVLPQAQVLFLALPLTAETRGLIGAEELALLPRWAFLINVARGGVVDEAALIKALEEGQLAGAGLDVFATEPLPEGSPLWGMDQVAITPHIAGLHPTYTERAMAAFAENLARFLSGKPLLNLVDRERGY